MKRLKELKRLVAIAAASMLLCGFMCQAAGGSGEVNEEHTHRHLLMDKPECFYTVFLYQHRYEKSKTTYPSGEVEYEYAYCDVVKHYYHPVYRCDCGDQYYGEAYNKDLHMSCGQ